uniref:GDSL esterase/lipase 4-like n=1 Tax=Fragaria vesca subsp. vesca TaxID=101020 RepID=UPI0005C8E89C|nr:PREDICTED: GDSL esterase/lipase 4-like [Fragaria vesca subsp. vesca]
MVIGNLTNVIREIYNKGRRKFGFSRLPPLGQVPAQRPGNRGTCVEELTSLANMHNAALPELLEKLKSKLQGFKYSIAKLDTYLTERINNPSEYGFKEGKAACCGSGPYGGIFSCGGKRSVTEYYWLCANVSMYFSTLFIQPKGFTSKSPSYGGTKLVMTESPAVI